MNSLSDIAAAGRGTRAGEAARGRRQLPGARAAARAAGALPRLPSGAGPGSGQRGKSARAARGGAGPGTRQRGRSRRGEERLHLRAAALPLPVPVPGPHSAETPTRDGGTRGAGRMRGPPASPRSPGYRGGKSRVSCACALRPAWAPRLPWRRGLGRARAMPSSAGHGQEAGSALTVCSRFRNHVSE